MVPEPASLSTGEKECFHEGMFDLDFDYHVLMLYNSPGTCLVQLRVS